MNYLLDTHTFLWLDYASQNLSLRVKSTLSNPRNSLFLSLTSAWEIQIKAQLGRLTLKDQLEVVLREQQEVNGILMLPVTLNHIFELRHLPDHHKDPF